MYKPVRYDSEGKPICEICNKSFNRLWSHAYRTHWLTANEYRKKFWLDMRQKLTSAESSELSRQHLLDNYEKCCKVNLVTKWVSTRFKPWDEWRTRSKMSEQTKLRIAELYKTRAFTKHNKLTYDDE